MEEAGGVGPPAKVRELSRERKKSRKGTASQNEDKGKSNLSFTGIENGGGDNVSGENKDGDKRGCRWLNKYDAAHKGQFMVYIDSYDEKGMRKFLSAITVSRVLLKLGVGGIIEVAKIGYGRVKVNFKDHVSANKLMEEEGLAKFDLVAKIFDHFISKIAIVFDIPTDIEEEEFRLGVITPIPILRCIRPTRRIVDQDGNERKIPSKNMKIVFKGNEIPKEITYSYVKIPVRHFISFTQCYRCFRFNHFAQHCKQNAEVCRECYRSHEGDKCTEKSCTNCEGNHPPTDKNCPARAKAFAIKKLMTLENLSIREARTRLRGVFQNSFSILEDNEANFPELKNKNKQTQRTQNNHSAAARAIHQVVPYAAVLKRNTNRERESANAKRTMTEHKKILEGYQENNKENGIGFNRKTSTGEMASNYSTWSQAKGDNKVKAVDFLHTTARETTEFLSNPEGVMADKNGIFKFIASLRDNINRSLNYLDADTIERSISMESLY